MRNTKSKPWDPFYTGLNSTLLSDDLKPDLVNHPPHYKLAGGLEVIDIIEAATKDLVGMDAVCTANAIKYILRWKHKGGVEDVEKAIWYLRKMAVIHNGGEDD